MKAADVLQAVETLTKVANLPVVSSLLPEDIKPALGLIGQAAAAVHQENPGATDTALDVALAEVIRQVWQAAIRARFGG